MDNLLKRLIRLMMWYKISTEQQRKEYDNDLKKLIKDFEDEYMRQTPEEKIRIEKILEGW